MTVRALDFPRLDTVAALKAAAEQAARITGAEGVAIAIGNAVAMCCCASVGNAPDVGVLVGPDSGLSGLCMRTSELIQCDDTATDSRLDPRAGQRTNLRSVLIVPVVVDGRLQAMLQAVSSKPLAFNSQHRELLSRMAQGIATLLSNAVVERPPKPSTTEQASAITPEGAGQRVDAAAPASLPRIASAKAETLASPTPSAASPESAIPQSALPRSEPREQPNAVPSPKVPGAAGSPDLLASAAVWRSLPGKTKAGIGIGTVVLLVLVLVVAWYLAGAGHSSPAGTASAPATQVSTAPSATPEHGTDAAKPEITIQQSSLSVAEGTPKGAGSAPQLTPGRLVRKVDPVCPAFAQGISGSVVLTALVTKEGKVTNVQFVRGPEALASPAIDAVRQWLYEPYRLGGTPVAVQTMIDIKFAPRQKP